MDGAHLNVSHYVDVVKEQLLSAWAVAKPTALAASDAAFTAATGAADFLEPMSAKVMVAQARSTRSTRSTLVEAVYHVLPGDMADMKAFHGYAATSFCIYIYILCSSMHLLVSVSSSQFKSLESAQAQLHDYVVRLSAVPAVQEVLESISEAPFGGCPMDSQ